VVDAVEDWSDELKRRVPPERSKSHPFSTLRYIRLLNSRITDNPLVETGPTL
jgi:hypothetical protein